MSYCDIHVVNIPAAPMGEHRGKMLKDLIHQAAKDLDLAQAWVKNTWITIKKELAELAELDLTVRVFKDKRIEICLAQDPYTEVLVITKNLISISVTADDETVLFSRQDPLNHIAQHIAVACWRRNATS